MKDALLTDVETPAVLIDRERLLRNIDWAQALANRHRLALRPHVKTHKCVEIARIQLERGAVGLTASKVDEALVFIEARASSVTVAYPLVDERKLRRLLSAAKQYGTDLRVVVDSRIATELLAGIAIELQMTVGAFVEIDVGLRRCGLSESDPAIVELARFVCSSSHVHFAGLLSHAGHAYGAANASGAAAVAADECRILQRVRSEVEAAGIVVPEVSVGSTPTVLASDSYEGITEIRPGNYVFMDRTPVRLGLASVEQVALTVLATVVSRNADYLIVDAGSKVLTSDLGAHGTAGAGGYGIALPVNAPESGTSGLHVARLSEEHGFIERAGSDLPIGTKLRIVPNHACPVVNLADELIIVSGDDEVARWRVAARGRL
ncbi:MAG TPA: alanine racemase [Chthoniobacterales bacterium]|nr:alanine racemase [Chthoniobacterales bacterium]